MEATTLEYAEYKEAAGTIAELRETAVKEAVSRIDFSWEVRYLTLRQGARADLSQVIADQQVALTQLKEKNDCSCSTQAATKERRDVHGRKPDQKDDTKQPEDSRQKGIPKRNAALHRD